MTIYLPIELLDLQNRTMSYIIVQPSLLTLTRRYECRRRYSAVAFDLWRGRASERVSILVDN
jgi:hypothetical protein